MKCPDLKVDAKTTRAIRAGHLHVLKSGILSKPRGLRPGEIVDVISRSFVARGYWDEGSPSVRILTLDKEQAIDGAFWRERITRAVELRRALLNLSVTDAWRAVNGEGDGLPGLVIESYSSYAVIRLETDALRPHLGAIVDAVRQVMRPRGLYEKRGGPQGGRGHHLGGSTAPDALPVREGRLRFLVRLSEGARTGLFLDMRDNRRVFARYARGRQVVNCFSYTGTMSLTAAVAGSPRVLSIDPSVRCAAWARENFSANGLPPESHEFVTGGTLDVLDRLARSSRRFDMALLDSPIFREPEEPEPAPRKEAKKKAAKKKAAKKKAAKRGSSRAAPAKRKAAKKKTAKKAASRRPAKKAAKKKGARRRLAPPTSAADVERYREGYADLVRAATAVLNPEGLLACSFVNRHLTRAEFVETLLQAAADAGARLQMLETHGLPPDHPTRVLHPEGRYLNFVVCALRQ
ncbi:MAG: class I SAM-dependent rRNA methyltransferase [Planctomycetota bacterium]|jgi:23S rRNA (cytosine1962-C5)-methyltransferase